MNELTGMAPSAPRNQQERRIAARGSRRLLSIPETCDRLGLGRSTIYGLISRGALKTVHVGRRHLVREDSICVVEENGAPQE
jgi:excisionase family DNA binding protein